MLKNQVLATSIDNLTSLDTTLKVGDSIKSAMHSLYVFNKRINKINSTDELTASALIAEYSEVGFGFVLRENKADGQVISSAVGIGPCRKLVVTSTYVGLFYGTSQKDSKVYVYNNAKMQIPFKDLLPGAYFASTASRQLNILPSAYAFIGRRLFELFEKVDVPLDAERLVYQDEILLAAYELQDDIFTCDYLPTTKKGAIRNLSVRLQKGFDKVPIKLDGTGVVLTAAQRSAAKKFVKDVKSGEDVDIEFCKAFATPESAALRIEGVPAFLLNVFDKTWPSSFVDNTAAGGSVLGEVVVSDLVAFYSLTEEGNGIQNWVNEYDDNDANTSAARWCQFVIFESDNLNKIATDFEKYRKDLEKIERTNFIGMVEASLQYIQHIRDVLGDYVTPQGFLYATGENYDPLKESSSVRKVDINDKRYAVTDPNYAAGDIVTADGPIGGRPHACFGELVGQNALNTGVNFDDPAIQYAIPVKTIVADAPKVRSDLFPQNIADWADGMVGYLNPYGVFLKNGILDNMDIDKDVVNANMQTYFNEFRERFWNFSQDVYAKAGHALNSILGKCNVSFKTTVKLYKHHLSGHRWYISWCNTSCERGSAPFGGAEKLSTSMGQRRGKLKSGSTRSGTGNPLPWMGLGTLRVTEFIRNESANGQLLGYRIKYTVPVNIAICDNIGCEASFSSMQSKWSEILAATFPATQFANRSVLECGNARFQYEDHDSCSSWDQKKSNSHHRPGEWALISPAPYFKFEISWVENWDLSDSSKGDGKALGQSTNETLGYLNNACKHAVDLARARINASAAAWLFKTLKPYVMYDNEGRCVISITGSVEGEYQSLPVITTFAGGTAAGGVLRTMANSVAGVAENQQEMEGVPPEIATELSQYAGLFKDLTKAWGDFSAKALPWFIDSVSQINTASVIDTSLLPLYGGLA